MPSAGARVLDLYAGSGALGIEALSRGAAHATFVDTDRAARRAIESEPGLDGPRRTGPTSSPPMPRPTSDAWRPAVPVPFDLVLLDPPYGTDDAAWLDLLALVAPVAPSAVVVAESDREVPVPDGWHALRVKRYGGTLVSVLLPPSPLSEPS